MSNENATMVALIGRPNVGKSTLFNRMVKRRDALVDPTPGVTRDRHYARVAWEDRPFVLVDTGGIDDEDDTITNHIRHQALLAIEEADVIFFLMDGREGLTPSDHEIVEILRRSEKKVFFIVNKIDSPEIEDTLLAPFWELGVEQLWPLSGDHGYGYTSLMEGLYPLLGKSELQLELPENTMKIAFLGRPNVGKSSLVNAIIGQERMVVSNIAGTTRDTIEETLTIDGTLFRFIDTAGLRETSDEVEKIGISRSYKKMNEASIVLALLDVTASEEENEYSISDIVSNLDVKSQKLIVLLNKVDVLGNNINVSLINNSVSNPNEKVVKLYISAKTGFGLDELRKLLSDSQKSATLDSDQTIVTNLRHYQALMKASESLENVKRSLAAGQTPDLLSEDLRQALHHLGTILGEVTTDEVLGNIFEHFCIGK